MFQKAKNSQGFTLVELMIVVAIIGILAAVAVPYYQRYVAKSRLTSLVIPGVHAIETNISTFYAVRGTAPDNNAAISDFDQDADTTCYNLSDLSVSNGSIAFKVTIDKSGTGCDGLALLDGDAFTAKGKYSSGKLYWDYVGGLADELGL